jgi:hypothetical protein
MWVPSDPTLSEGLRAYASKQATLQTMLTSSFKLLWKTLLEMITEEARAEDELNDNDNVDCDEDEDGSDEDEDRIGPGLAEDSDEDGW